jgi:hypothetical protein
MVGFSSLTFAQEPVVLTQVEMDSVTAAALVEVGDVNVNNNQIQVVLISGKVIQHQ